MGQSHVMYLGPDCQEYNNYIRRHAQYFELELSIMNSICTAHEEKHTNRIVNKKNQKPRG
jgi:hypothetical protein